MSWKVGDYIRVIDRKYKEFPMWGWIQELDEHPFGESFALVKLDDALMDPPPIWVNLRLANKEEKR